MCIGVHTLEDTFSNNLTNNLTTIFNYVFPQMYLEASKIVCFFF
jgi:hypothetical protein